MGIPKRLTLDITIYPRWTHKLTGQILIMRRVLHRCTWQSDAISVALSTGQILQTPTTISVFKKTSGLEYIKPHEWLALPDDELTPYWTVDLTGTARPIIVPWEESFEFPVYPVAGITGTASSQATSDENSFISNNPGAIRAAQVENNQFSGGERGGHILIMGN